MTFSNTGDRTYTFSGDPITFTAQVGSDARILTSGTPYKSAITFNNDIFFTHVTTGSNTRFVIGGSVNSVSRFSTITFNGNILTDAPGVGVGSRDLGILSDVDTKIVLNGSNEVSHVLFAGAGEVVVGHSSALGIGTVQRSSYNNTLSLRGSDLTIAGNGSYSWSAGLYTTAIRISESAPSSTDRTITMASRLSADGDAPGGFEWVDNINSTGKLILDLKYAAGNAQNANLLTNASAIVRFSQTGNTTYSGIISGAGQLEKVTGTGTTTLSGANTYTGDTLISAGTLLLSSTGKLNFLIGDDGVNNQITGTGNVTLDGTFTFDLLGASGGVGDSWTIVDMAALGTVTYGGTFAVEGFSQNGNLWTSGMYQFDQTDGMLSVVPEPSTAILLLGGAACLMGLRRGVRSRA